MLPSSIPADGMDLTHTGTLSLPPSFRMGSKVKEPQIKMNKVGNNPWWIRGTNLRVLKRYLPSNTIWHDGMGFSVLQWNFALDDVARLKPGDPIYNPYKSTWTKVSSVRFDWNPIQRYRYDFSHPWGKLIHGRVVGRYINFFVIFSEDGYMIYDSPEYLKYFHRVVEPSSGLKISLK